MASQGPNNPSAASDVSNIGTLTWSDPTNVYASDDSRATAVSTGTFQATHYLKTTGYGFSIPAGNNIDGILVEAEGSKVGAGGMSLACYMVKGGTIQGIESEGSSKTLTTTDAYVSWGGSTSLWNKTWAPADINDSTFGAAVAGALAASGNTCRVDHVRITVYYSPQTADVGAFTLSGQTAGLKVARKLAAAAGSFTLAGQAAGLLTGYTLGAGAGSFALSGQDAGLRATRTLPAEVGAFTLTGQAAGLQAARGLAAGVGTFTLTGQDAGLLAARTLTAEVGIATLSGQSAGLLAGRTLTAGAGAFTLAGQGAGLYATRLLLGAVGSFVLTGQSAGLPAGWRLAADAGAFVLIGQDAGLTYAAGSAPSGGEATAVLPDLSQANDYRFADAVLASGDHAYLDTADASGDWAYLDAPP